MWHHSKYIFFGITNTGTTATGAGFLNNPGQIWLSTQTAANNVQGAGATIHSATPIAAASSSPVMEAVIQPDMTNATSTTMLVGFDGEYNASPVIGSEPSTFVGFIASTTNANWFALVRDGTTSVGLLWQR